MQRAKEIVPRVIGSAAPTHILRLVITKTALSLPHHNCYALYYVFN